MGRLSFVGKTDPVVGCVVWRFGLVGLPLFPSWP